MGHPQSNGDERLNGIIKPDIRKLCADNGGSYANNTQAAMALYNGRPHSITKIAPGVLFTKCLSANPNYFDINSRFVTTDQQASAMDIIETVLRLKEKRSAVDRRRREKSLPPERKIKAGDNVLVQVKHKGINSNQRYQAKVITRHRNNTLTLQFVGR